MSGLRLGALGSLMTGLLVLGLSLPTAARDAGQKRAYTVEMLLFRNLGLDSLGGEVWSTELRLPQTRGAVELSPDGLPPGFKIGSADSGELSRAARLIDRSSRYQLLRHLVWEQPGLAEDQAIPVHIHGGRDYGIVYPDRAELPGPPGQDLSPVPVAPVSPVPLRELDGTVTISLGRYLHVHTDLVYRQPDPESPAAADDGTPVLINAPVIQERRMRSGELHYLDHPFLGILVKINPVKPDD